LGSAKRSSQGGYVFGDAPWNLFNSGQPPDRLSPRLVAGVFWQVLRGSEPVLVDTGAVVQSGEFMPALRSVIDPTDLKWIWLTHRY
jgi:glyoxylase-like metal-dependent hydrolase (beta-lactamase superfamily II)